MEEWRDIPGYEGLYVVSNVGRVRRLSPRYGDGMKKLMDCDGYRHTTLSKNGVLRSFGVHVLVALAFIGPAPDGKEPNHKDGLRANNVPDNLEYLTHQENVRYSWDVLGRDHAPVRGEANGMAKATSAEVAEAKRLLAGGATKKDVAKQFGRHLSWAYRVANGEARVHG